MSMSTCLRGGWEVIVVDDNHPRRQALMLVFEGVVVQVHVIPLHVGSCSCSCCCRHPCWQLQPQLLLLLLSLPRVHVETWFCQQKKRKNNHGRTFVSAVLVVPFCVRVVVHGRIGHVEWEGAHGGGCGETQR